MTPLLHPSLVNEPFGDPAVYVEFKFAKRALLFDLGDLQPLHPRKILRLSDIFVSHMHVDHFIGFDRILRTLLGRDTKVRLFGPAGILDAVEHRLAGYTWNLVEQFDTDFTLSVTEVHSESEALSASFRLQSRFRRENQGEFALADGLVLDDGTVRVNTRVLDHGIPCLAFAVQERAHVNVWKSRLLDRGLTVGPWLQELKHAAMADQPDDTPIRVPARHPEEEARFLPLGTLKNEVLQIVPGQKIAYVVDAAFTGPNVEKITDLARCADTLFIEACFAQDDSDRAAERRHLTTAQAGYLARRATVRRLIPFHFSPRYKGEEARLRQEVEDAFTDHSHRNVEKDLIRSLRTAGAGDGARG